MLTPRKKQILFWLLVVGFGLWIRWWASSNFLLEGQICDPGDPPKNCEIYDVFFYSAWKLAATANQWSALVTAIATGFVAWFTWTLWRSSDELGKVSKQSADVAEKQMLIAARQTDIQSKQHAVTRLQYLGAHRPRVLVRGISVLDQRGIVVGERTSVQIPVINIGDTDAKMEEMAARIFIVDDIKPINVGGDFHKIDVSRNPPITRGVYVTLGVRTDTPITQEQLYGLTQKTLFMVCVGYIQYKDEGGGMRSMGFARVLQGQSNRFTPIEDPEYEFNY